METIKLSNLFGEVQDVEVIRRISGGVFIKRPTVDYSKLTILDSYVNYMECLNIIVIKDNILLDSIALKNPDKQENIKAAELLFKTKCIEYGCKRNIKKHIENNFYHNKNISIFLTKVMIKKIIDINDMFIN